MVGTQMFEIAIVGLGPAGIFTLASLPENMLTQTIVFESNMIGGDVALYGDIHANITKQEILTAFRKIPRWFEKQETFLKNYENNDCPLLQDVCKQMQEWIRPDVSRTQFHTKRMVKLLEGDQRWILQSQDELFEAKKVIMCIGSKPKTLDLPKATLPLNQCLSKSVLERHVSVTDKVVVMGTAHSGTLIMKNLQEMGCKDVVGIYKDKPFSYARDGILGGLKQESAKIADEIRSKAWGELCPTLISIHEFSNVYRAIERADLVLYSCGFEESVLHYYTKDNSQNTAKYDPITNRFADMANVWGFGIAFPSHKPGTNFPDIGFHGFITAIQNSLSAIV